MDSWPEEIEFHVIETEGRIPTLIGQSSLSKATIQNGKGTVVINGTEVACVRNGSGHLVLTLS